MTTLEELVTKCESLLLEVGEFNWASKIRSILDTSQFGPDARSAENILSWYGGMGSFNDLIITEANGHRTRGKEESKLNRELEILQTRIYDEARRLLRDK